MKRKQALRLLNYSRHSGNKGDPRPKGERSAVTGHLLCALYLSYVWHGSWRPLVHSQETPGRRLHRTSTVRLGIEAIYLSPQQEAIQVLISPSPRGIWGLCKASLPSGRLNNWQSDPDRTSNLRTLRPKHCLPRRTLRLHILPIKSNPN